MKHSYQPKRNDETGEYACGVCGESFRSSNHPQHQPGQRCIDRYGNGTPGCEACDLKAEKHKHPECPTNPYRGYCGSAWDNKPSCKCGRLQSTD